MNFRLKPAEKEKEPETVVPEKEKEPKQSESAAPAGSVNTSADTSTQDSEVGVAAEEREAKTRVRTDSISTESRGSVSISASASLNPTSNSNTASRRPSVAAEDVVLIYAPKIFAQNIQLSVVQTTCVPQMKALYSALDVKGIVHKTKLKKYIKACQKTSSIKLSEEQIGVVKSLLTPVEAEGVELEHVNIQDYDEIQELFDLCSCTDFGTQTQILKYLKDLSVSSTAGGDEKEKEKEQEKKHVVGNSDNTNTQGLAEFLSKERYGDGQLTLFRVLNSYAAFNPTLGYTQGMGYIAGLCLYLYHMYLSLCFYFCM